MKKLILTAALTASSFAFAGTPWKIDTAHAGANFAVKHLAVSTVKGTLGAVTGTVDLDDNDVTKSKVTVSIDVKGLNTMVQKRDDHLRSKDFLEADTYPAITFTSTKIEKGEGNKVKVTGDLKIKTTTKSVVIDGELTPEVKNPFSSIPTRGFSGSTSINRKDFGLTWNVALETGGVLVGDDVKITVEAELNKDVPAPAPAKGAPPAKK
ncbi:MAG: polyisoprenoid-binding protein [Archangium sp.]|nr:polyisoprenoid-binding protein [Archangium sp.]